MTNQDIVTEYAKAYNNLNAVYIKEHLAEDFKYASQWVFEEIESKKEYLKYLENKFTALRNSTKKIVARMGSYNNKSCIALYQIDMSKKVDTQVAILLMKFENEKIISANLCMIPTINDVQLLEAIPV